MNIAKENLQVHRSSPGRRFLLYGLFLIVLLDSLPNIGLGIGLGLSAMNLFLYFLLVLIAIRTVVGIKGIKFTELDVHLPFLLLMGYAGLTWAILGIFEPSYSAFQGAIAFKNQLLDLFLLMVIFRYGVESQEDFVWLIRAAMMTVFISSIVVLIDFLNIPNLDFFGTHKGRAEGIVGEPNQYGALLAFCLPIAVAVMPRNRSTILYWVWRVAMFSSVAMLISTGSRGAYLAVFGGYVAGAIYLRHYLNMKQVFQYSVATMAVVSILTLGLILYYPDLLTGRFEDTVSGSLDTASAGRVQIWAATARVMLEWPYSLFVGYGWNSAEFSGIWKSAHNEYLDRLYELGFLGLILFITLLVCVITRVKKVLRTTQDTYRPILIGYTFGMLSVTVAIFFVALSNTWSFVWAITGMVMGLQARLRETPLRTHDESNADTESRVISATFRPT